MHNMQGLFGILSGIFTAVLIVLMSGVAVWAWSDRRRQAFDAAARVPLEEDSAVTDPSHRERAS